MFQAKFKAAFTLFVFTLALTAPAMLGHATPVPAAPVVVSPDFTMSVTPTFSTRKRGTGMLWDIAITAVDGFNGTVNFTVTGLFQGSRIGFVPTPVTGSGTSGFSILTQKPPNTPIGTFTLTVTGTSGSLSHSQQVTIKMV
jgi:hypothetical protein